MVDNIAYHMGKMIFYSTRTIPDKEKVHEPGFNMILQLFMTVEGVACSQAHNFQLHEAVGLGLVYQLDPPPCLA